MASYDDLILAGSPYAYWPLRDNITQVNELVSNYWASLIGGSGNGYTQGYAGPFFGTGATYFNWSPIGYAVVDDASCGDFEWTDAFSVEFWVSWYSGDFNMVAISKWITGTGTGWEVYCPSGGVIQFSLGQGTTVATQQLIKRWAVNTAPIGNNDMWHHFCFTYDGSGTMAGIKLYIDGTEKTNGTQQGVASFSSGSIRTSAPLHLANETTAYGWRGYLSSMAIHRRVLGAAEILTHVAYVPAVAGAPEASSYDEKLRNSNPVVEWRLDEVSPRRNTQIYDRGPSAKPLTTMCHFTRGFQVQPRRQGYLFPTSTNGMYALDSTLFDQEWNQPFSAFFWMYNGGTPYPSSSNSPIFGKMVGSSPYKGFGLGWIGSTARMRWEYNSDATNRITRDFPMPAGFWTAGPAAMAVTYDGSGNRSALKLYVNGNEITNPDETGVASISTSVRNSERFSLFCYAPLGSLMPGYWYNYTFNSFSDFCMYDRELTAVEIQALASPIYSLPARSVLNTQHVLRSAARPAKNLITSASGSGLSKKGAKLDPGIG